MIKSVTENLVLVSRGMGSAMLLTDNPIPGADEDEFGFSEHAKALCDAIKDMNHLPLTVGIFGPWGSGKSSFLNICDHLLGERGFVVVRFNAWKYDKRDEIWHALIQSLLDELIRQAEESPAPKRLRKAIKDARDLQGVLFRLAVRSIVPILTAGAITGTDVDTNIEAVKAAVSAMNQKRQVQLDYRHVNTFEKDFADTVEALTRNTDASKIEKRKVVVVLVDDLDRCRGESALMVLESLRLFTGDSPCVFMVTMDHQALMDAASARFGRDKAKRGRDYLEKLINFPYHLPVARFDSINLSARRQLDFLADDSTMSELIRLNMDGNPRRVRRFVNTFNFTIATMERAGAPLTEVRQRKVAVLLMFRQEHPAFFEALREMLRRDREAWAKLEHAAKMPDDIALPADLRELVESDPRLLRAIASVAESKDGPFRFPPPPTESEVSALTEAMVLVPLLQQDPGTPSTLNAASRGPLVR
jgi:KAP family P-loop domain